MSAAPENPYESPRAEWTTAHGGEGPPDFAALPPAGLELEFHGEMNDLVSLQLAAQESGGMATVQRWTRLIMFGFLALLALPWAFHFSTEVPLGWIATGTFLVLTVGTEAFIAITGSSPVVGGSYVALPSTLSSLYGEEEIARRLGLHRVVVTPTEIRVGLHQMRVAIDWAAIQRIVEFEGCCLLFQSGVGAVIVPRRAFPHEAEFAQFVRRARTHATRVRAAAGLPAPKS